MPTSDNAALRVKHLEQQDLVTSLIAQVMPLLALVVAEIDGSSDEAASHNVAFEHVLVVDAPAVTHAQRIVQDSVVQRPPDTIMFFPQLAGRN